MSRLLIVDADALERLLYAASDRPGPDLREAMASLLRNGTAPAPEPRPWLSVAEAASRFAVSERTVRRTVDRGDWPHLRIGRRLLVAANGPERTREDTDGDVVADGTDDTDGQESAA
jgi:excisionase family DNA binding protein